MISICLPVYQSESTIKDCIDSVLRQDTEFELIIVNDGSTDKTREIIESYKDDRIKLYNTDNKGISAARKLAFEKSKGEYVAVHDSDVIMNPNRLSFGLKHIKDKDIFYSNTGLILKDGSIKDNITLRDINKQSTEDILDPNVPNGNQVVPNFTILAKRECFEGAYNPEYKINDDLWTIYYWKTKGYTFTHSKKTLCYHNETGFNVSDTRLKESLEVADKIRKKAGMKGTLVSVVMPAYNSELYIAKAIESVIRQSYKGWELIIVNDGSKDATQNIIDYYIQKDSRIKCVSLSENKGISYARNRGIEASRGEYIAVMDSDDLMNPERLKLSLKAIKNVDFITGPYGVADMNAKVDHWVKPTRVTIESVKKNGAWPHVCILGKKACFSGAYRDDFRANDDAWLVWQFFKRNYTYNFTEEPLMIVRLHTNRTTLKGKKEIDRVNKIIQKEIDESIWNN